MTPTERDQRLVEINALIVGTTQSLDALRSIGTLHGSWRGAHEAACMLLLGLTGTGKTLTVLEHARRHPASDGDGDMRRPVLIVTVPARCTLRSLAGAILIELGDILPGRGSEAELTARVRHHLRRQGVELLVLDEFQHLINKRDARIVHEAADWVKGLLSANLCPILLVGQISAKRIIETNGQLERRVQTICCFRPYDWRIDDDRLEFRAVLDAIDARLGFPERSDLGRTDTALRIHHFSRGLLGQAMRLVRKASEIALAEDRPRLTRSVLAEAVDRLRLAPGTDALNPFRIPEIDAADPAPMDSELHDLAADEARHPSRRRLRAGVHGA
ncbi:TniB family NTP-binding protein [Azospirillum sp. Sh1]|uniref:TniB family NTP-binding protein n=1 Tax=Azospirillum sp. Sh1 TaxID=2607285 RepID=UPI0011EF50C4|nr:TniB family NTP-binding protein [Azospirillum sp. Sh1]KAA0578202.1 AAA family ATPase [Azospirillum sp. Sh1]